MSAWARPGKRCVCICRNWKVSDPAVPVHLAPAFGEICTITSVMSDADGTWLSLEGHGDACEFSVTAFRPLVEQPESYDLAIFYSMLDEVGVEA